MKNSAIVILRQPNLSEYLLWVFACKFVLRLELFYYYAFFQTKIKYWGNENDIKSKKQLKFD